jgi:glycosyltransferase 2 family protein
VSTSAGARRAKWILSAGFLALLIVFGREVEWRATWIALTGASVSVLLLATIINFASLLAKAVIWWLFLQPVGVTSVLAVRATIAGAALSNLAPANAGEAARALIVARTARVASPSVFAALAMERLLNGIGLVLLLAIAPLVISLPDSIARWHRVAAVALVAMVGFLGLAIASDVSPPRERHIRGAFDRVHVFATHFVAGVSAVATLPRVVSGLVLSFAAWAMQLATYHLAAVALHFPVHLAGTLAILLAENAAFVVRVTPGSVGIFQIIYTASAAALGLHSGHAVAVALVLQALQILPVNVVGLLVAPHLLQLYRSAQQTLA